MASMIALESLIGVGSPGLMGNRSMETNSCCADFFVVLQILVGDMRLAVEVFEVGENVHEGLSCKEDVSLVLR